MNGLELKVFVGGQIKEGFRGESTVVVTAKSPTTLAEVLVFPSTTDQQFVAKTSPGPEATINYCRGDRVYCGLNQTAVDGLLRAQPYLNDQTFDARLLDVILVNDPFLNLNNGDMEVLASAHETYSGLFHEREQ